MGVFARGLALFAALVAGAAGASAQTTVNISLVEELHRNEPYEGHLFHDGLLWETRTKQADGERHRVDIFDSQGVNKVTTVMLDHTAGAIYPYSAHQVIVIGKSYTDQWRTHFTIITRNGTNFTTRLTTFPIEYMMDDGTGTAATGLYFTEPGSAAVYRFNNGAVSQIGDTISGPGETQLAGDQLWVIERRSFDNGDEGLARINTRTGQTDRTFGANGVRNGLTELKNLSGYPWIAVSETYANQILFVDRDSNTLVHTVAVDGEPRGLTTVGGCLVVTAEATKTVHFISLWGAEPQIIDSWDATGAGDRLKKPRKIAINPDTGRVFLRSSYMCPTCASTQSSVFALEQDGHETIQKCLANAPAPTE